MLCMQLTVQQAIELNLCQELKLTGGTTETIFPEVEALLQSSADMQNALDRVAVRKSAAHKYRSVMDFLFCELNPEWRSHCFRFYLDGKEDLRHVLTMAQRKIYAWELCQALMVAYTAFCEDRRLSWSAFQHEVQVAVA